MRSPHDPDIVIRMTDSPTPTRTTRPPRISDFSDSSFALPALIPTSPVLGAAASPWPYPGLGSASDNEKATPSLGSPQRSLSPMSDARPAPSPLLDLRMHPLNVHMRSRTTLSVPLDLRLHAGTLFCCEYRSRTDTKAAYAVESRRHASPSMVMGSRTVHLQPPSSPRLTALPVCLPPSTWLSSSGGAQQAEAVRGAMPLRPYDAARRWSRSMEPTRSGRSLGLTPTRSVYAAPSDARQKRQRQRLAETQHARQ
jgi:hypothetical protein